MLVSFSVSIFYDDNSFAFCNTVEFNDAGNLCENTRNFWFTIDRKKNIKVRDRATLFNLLIGLNGYTVSSGVISHELNGENIIARPLLIDEYMKIGIIKLKNIILSQYAISFIESIKKHIPN